MTTVGLVGGLGPESTVDYYLRLIKAWEQVVPGSAPSLVETCAAVMQFTGHNERGAAALG